MYGKASTCYSYKLFIQPICALQHHGKEVLSYLLDLMRSLPSGQWIQNVTAEARKGTVRAFYSHCFTVCMYVCMYVRTCACMLCMYVCTYVCMYVRTYVCMYLCITTVKQLDTILHNMLNFH